MKKLIIGTKNPGKRKHVEDLLTPLGLLIRGLPRRKNFPEVIEDGKTAQENARKKATSYARELKQTVLSIDNALYFDRVGQALQPGIHVRRIHGRIDTPTDQELLDYYSQIVSKFGSSGILTGCWEFAMCIVNPTGKIFETTIVAPRIFKSRVGGNIIEGYPLESLQIDLKTNKYISDMNQEEKNLFWQKDLSEPFCSFVRKVLLL